MTKEEANELIINIREEMYDEVAWYVWNHCHDEAMTKDILQEVFLEVCRHADGLETHECYQGWVYKTAKFKLMKTRNKNTVRKQRQISWEEMNEDVIAAEDEYDFLIFDEYSHVISADRLDLLKEHYHVGKTIEDIAAEKGKTIGSIKMQMKRARDELRNYISGKSSKKHI